MKKQNFALLFGNNPDISLDERVRVISKLNLAYELSKKSFSNKDCISLQSR